MADGRKEIKIAINILFILFSLTVVLSMALDIFMVLSLKVNTNQEMLIARAALRRIEFVCRAKQKRSISEKGMRILKKLLKEISEKLARPG